MDWHDLQKKKVDELREMAKEFGTEGTSGLHKDEVVALVAKNLGIDKPHLVVEGLDTGSIKQKIRLLKGQVQEALAAKDRKAAKAKRRQIHSLKRRIHKAAHLTH